METLPSGGECISKRYMEFSHLCTVRDYLPTVDYCCCAHQQLVLCCRYHQNWNHFRCNDADDVLMMTYDFYSDYSVSRAGVYRHDIKPAVHGPFTFCAGRPVSLTLRRLISITIFQNQELQT